MVPHTFTGNGLGISGADNCQICGRWGDTPATRECTDYDWRDAAIARITAEITTLRARLETVEAETIERAVKRIKADKDIQGLVKARIFTVLQNLESRHD